MRPSLMLAISAITLAGGCSPAADTSPTLAAPLEPNPAAIAPAPYIPDERIEGPYLIPIGYERPVLR
jgi:hypothetical protein